MVLPSAPTPCPAAVLQVEKLYSYCKRYHPKTAIMASGLRSKEEALGLAGCDYLVRGWQMWVLLSPIPSCAWGSTSPVASGD